MNSKELSHHRLAQCYRLDNPDTEKISNTSPGNLSSNEIGAVVKVVTKEIKQVMQSG